MHSFYFIVSIAMTHTETVKEDVPHKSSFLLMCNCGHLFYHFGKDVFITV